MRGVVLDLPSAVRIEKFERPAAAASSPRVHPSGLQDRSRGGAGDGFDEHVAASDALASKSRREHGHEIEVSGQRADQLSSGHGNDFGRLSDSNLGLTLSDDLGRLVAGHQKVLGFI
jgi:hypothetical protein